MNKFKKKKDVVEDMMAEEQEEVVVVEEQPKLDFDAWFSMRTAQIPPQHHKEIIKADFKGRKVPMMATVAEFDEALTKYGIKLV